MLKSEVNKQKKKINYWINRKIYLLLENFMQFNICARIIIIKYFNKQGLANCVHLFLK